MNEQPLPTILLLIGITTETTCSRELSKIEPMPLLPREPQTHGPLCLRFLLPLND
ncbi:hypothetical protein LEMLEM_LOCUS8853 [Lemmus lemmus]